MTKFNQADRRARKTVELPAHVDDAISDLSKSLGISVAEIIRLAAARLVKEEEKRAEGYDIGAFKLDDEDRVVRAYLYEL